MFTPYSESRLWAVKPYKGDAQESLSMLHVFTEKVVLHVSMEKIVLHVFMEKIMLL